MKQSSVEMLLKASWKSLRRIHSEAVKGWIGGCTVPNTIVLANRYHADPQFRLIVLIGLSDVLPDPDLWVEAAVHSEAPWIYSQSTPPEVVTDNLDTFSNRGASHRMSTPSSPRDEATLTLSLAPTFPCRGYRGYRSYR